MPRRYLADLHIHSHYSRATSPDCNLPQLARWAQLKGVTVVGTGDFTHPGWFGELEQDLEPCGSGLHRLRPSRVSSEPVPERCRSDVYFLLTAEISSIYRREGRVHRVHSLLLAPRFEAVRRINRRLDAIGNVRSDGRPILKLDPRDLLDICLEADPDCALIPAHVWTPWFSMLGARSGFDSIEACFGDRAPAIFAVETGLSSDPPMNWRVGGLDKVALVSNSDLHSPANLGRNANVFFGEPDYSAMMAGLRQRDPSRCGGTIDLYPEEGKYHLDGHRACGVALEPEEAIRHDNRCPACGGRLVQGVLHRVNELATRPDGRRPPGVLPHAYIVPLPELLGDILACGAGSRRVQRAWLQALEAFGPELDILLRVPLERLTLPGLEGRLAESVRCVREGRVLRRGGYDGVPGTVRPAPAAG